MDDLGVSHGIFIGHLHMKLEKSGDLCRDPICL